MAEVKSDPVNSNFVTSTSVLDFRSRVWLHNYPDLSRLANDLYLTGNRTPVAALSTIQFEAPDRILVEGKSSAIPLGYLDLAVLDRNLLIEQWRKPGDMLNRNAIGLGAGDAQAVLGEEMS